MRRGDASSANARYLNRLSDLLFVQSRWIAAATGHAEVLWQRGLQPPPPGRALRGRARLAAGVCAWISALALLLPHLAIFAFAFADHRAWQDEVLPTRYTLANFAELFGDVDRAAMDAARHRWNMWVQGYDRQKQFDLLKNAGWDAPDSTDLLRLAALALAVGSK